MPYNRHPGCAVVLRACAGHRLHVTFLIWRWYTHVLYQGIYRCSVYDPRKDGGWGPQKARRWSGGVNRLDPDFGFKMGSEYRQESMEVLRWNEAQRADPQ